MKSIARLLVVLALGLGATAARAGDVFDDYANRLTAPEIRAMILWHNQLPAVGNVGQAFIGCHSRTQGTIAQFERNFDVCWNGVGVPGACAHRCGAEYHTFGFFSPAAAGGDLVDYAIFCRCDQIVHSYNLHPVPQTLVDLGIAD